MTESKITYVLALDVTKVTEGFKKVQDVTAAVDKNLHVLASDLGKIGESSWLNKAFGGAASANQKVLELAKAMQTLKETATRDYAARAIHSQDLVALLTKEKVALEALRKAALDQTKKGTFSQGLADTSKAIANIQQQITYHDKLAKSMEKELYALEEITRKKKLLAELDANARKRSAQETGINLIRPSEILGTSKGKAWKASDILTANEVKILEANVQRVKELHKQSIQEEVAYRASLQRLASTAQMAYNAKFVQKLPSPDLTKYDPEKSPFKAVVAQQSKDGLAREKAYTNEAKVLADTRTSYIKQKLAEEEQAHKLTIANEVKTRQDAANKAIANAAKVQASIAKSTGIGQKVPTVETNKILSTFAKPNYKPYVADLELLITKEKEYQASLNATAKERWDAIVAEGKLKKAERDRTNQQLADLDKAKAASLELQRIQFATTRVPASESTFVKGMALATKRAEEFRAELIRVRKEAKETAFMQSGFGTFTRIEATLASRTPNERKADTTSAQSDYKNKLEAENKALKEQARISAESSAQRKKDEQDLLKVREQALTSYNQAMSANANAMKQMFQANTKLHGDAIALNADYDKTSAKIQTLIDKQNSRLKSIEATTKATRDERDAIIQSTLAWANKAKLDTMTQASNISAKASVDYRTRIEEEAANRRQQLEQQKLSWMEQARINVENKIEASSLASIARLKGAELARIAAIQAREDTLQAHRTSMMQTAQGGIYNGAMLGSGAASSKPTGYTQDLRASADKQTGLIKGMYETQTAYNQRVKEAIALQEEHKKKLINLDKVHKPFLERIFDLVVGYKLINAAVNTFTNALRSVPEAGLQFETTYATLKAVFSVTTKVNQELKFLDELAQSAGISIDTLRSSFVDFAASAKFSGEKVENIQEIFANISKAGMVLHLPADKMKSAFTALNQMYAKNQVMMEELKRQLGNQLPAAVNIFALSMGKTTRQLMDDMKKGLVVPKETILNFSRTYAAMFADPASLEYASQGVNAHIQRLSTAWTNFATTVYESSKGGIKGGLSIATSAIDMLTNHMEALKNITIVTMSVLGVGLVSHLGKATLALMATRNAAMASAGAMSALTGAAATAGGVGAWATISTFFKGIGASLLAMSPWIKIVAGIGLAVMALKDFEVGTTVVKSSLGALDGKAVSMQESITIGDMVIASWDTLIEKGQKFLNIQKEAETNADKASPKEAKNSLLPWALGKTASMLPTGSAGGKLLNTGYNLMYANTVQAKQKQSLAEEATRQTEYLNERVKETLLAGTSGTVDETMAGMTKAVTTALGRIDADFNRTKQQIQGSADVKTSQLQLEIAKTVVAEKQGSITAYESKKRQLSLQQQISALQLDVLKKEKAALEDKARKEEAISQSRLDDSVEARKYNAAYLKLGLMQKFKQEMPQALVESKAFKTTSEAGTALVAGTISQDTLNQAREQYNATHLDHGFKKIEDVSEKAIVEATKNTVETWKVYEQAMDAHKAMTMRVAEGVEETNTKTETQTEVLNRIADLLAPKANTVAESTTSEVAGALYDTFATASKPLGAGKYDSIVESLASKYTTVDPNLVKAMMVQESGGNKGAVSPKGAGGLMQIMPATAQRFGVTNRFDPEQSVEGSYKYLTFLEKQFKGNVPLMLAGYNAGEGAVAKHGNTIPPYKETQNYVKSIMGMYMPSKSAIKSGITKPEDATAKTLAEIEAQKPKIEAETNKISGEILSGTQELVDLAFENTKATLQNSFQQIKTQKDLELAKVENTTIPLSDKQRLAKTSAIDAEFAPKLASKIDELVKNAKEEITRTADTAKVSTLESDILNLTKERAGIEAEVLKNKATMELNKILPLQDALARRQFEIQKSLEESLGIYNEKTILQQQDLNNEELIKLVYQEKLRLADKNSGLTAEEVAKNTELLAIMDKQVKQLSQVELMKARIAQAEEKTSTFQAYSDAAAANAPINQASKMGVSGNFIGAMATEETARLNYGAKQANFEAQKVAYGNAQKGKEGTNEWYKLQTQIEQTTTAMNDLALAKDAVINQATADTMNSIGDHFVGWANGAETVKEAFRGIAIDFAKMIQEILMNELKLAAVKGIMSLISGGIGGMSGSGSIGSTGATSAIGIAGFATGGDVRGTGTGTSDSIPSIVPIGSYVLNAKASAKAKKNRLINLSHGEVVISPEQVAQLGLDNLNTMNAQGYATGGLVGGAATSSSTKPTGKNSNVYNINVAVPEGTSNPQQFGKDTGVEIYKAIAREEAKRAVNRYDKMKMGGR